MAELYAGVEAGGTKWVCAVGSGPGDLRAVIRFPTGEPHATIDKAIRFFQAASIQHGQLEAIGIGSFGPLGLDPDSERYGFITSTPKPGWANTDLTGAFDSALNIPIGFDTDVNAAALGEARWGAARGLVDFIYLTIGTGIGGGGMSNGRLIHGLVHPEMGHILVPHNRDRDPFPGVCPYHGDCFEGLATGPAIEARWGQRGETLTADHPAWDLEAHYIALGLVNLICSLSPRRIILGGGVMEQNQLFPQIRKNVTSYLNGYIASPEIINSNESYIVPPALGSQAGVLGALALAEIAAGGK
jgi:fructokinase